MPETSTQTDPKRIGFDIDLSQHALWPDVSLTGARATIVLSLPSQDVRISLTRDALRRLCQVGSAVLAQLALDYAPRPVPPVRPGRPRPRGRAGNIPLTQAGRERRDYLLGLVGDAEN
jgi:hypothetical protein